MDTVVVLGLLKLSLTQLIRTSARACSMVFTIIY